MRTRTLLSAAAIAILAGGCGQSSDPEPQPAPSAAATSSATPTPQRTREPTPEPTRRPPRKVLDGAGVAAFDTLAAEVGGEVGLVVGPPGAAEPVVLGTVQDGSAWSTIKVPIALRVIEQAGGVSGLSPDQESLITRALTVSDNAAADALFASLGDSDEARAVSVGEVLRTAGDTTTVVSAVGRGEFSPYGQTQWPLQAQHAFMARLAGDCLPEAAGADLVLSLMGQVSADQAWGLGVTGPTARFKGGWGPGEDGRYLVRQMGVVDVNDTPLVVAVAALPGDGQFASGTRMLSEVAIWLTQHVKPVTSPGC